MAKIVFSGLVTAWRFAGWPMRTSPSLAKATMDGVVREPSAFSITFACLPSMTATQEFVVPRSMPITLLTMTASFTDDPVPSSKPAFRVGVGLNAVVAWKP